MLDTLPTKPPRWREMQALDMDAQHSTSRTAFVGDGLAGLRVLVTGGGSGIGAVTSEWLRERGARVAVLDLQPGVQPDNARGFVCDVRSDTSVREAVDASAAWLGGADVLVNNAGIASLGDIEQQSDAEWHAVFDVNVFGMVRATRAVLPWLKQSPRAAIVNLSSAVARMGLPNRTLYSATKGAILSMTRAMAADYVGIPIRVNCVTPGVVDTPWQARAIQTANNPALRRAQLQEMQPNGRLVQAQEVAAAIAYLASPSSGATTGIDLPVDGGMLSLHLASASAVR